MAKRASRTRGRRGQGSITERDGKYLARWSTTDGGKRLRASKTFPLRNDAEWWLAEARRHGDAPGDPTVAEFLEAWLAGKRGVAPSTYAQYANHVHLHLIPVLGGYRLLELRRRHVEAFVENRTAHTSERLKRPLSPATVGKLLATLRSALAEAVPREIPDNPADRVQAPKVEREPVTALTKKEATAIIEAVRKTWMEQIVRVLLGSGMRIGEAVALNQGDVHEGWVGLRKSKTRIRAVRLSADADEAIHEAIRQAPRVGPREPVFFSPRSRRGGLGRDRMSRDALGHGLPHRLEMGGLDRLSPHGLRHGTATLMVAAGVPMRMVAEQLGHTTTAMTARYSHVSPESQAAALLVLDDAVGHEIGHK